MKPTVNADEILEYYNQIGSVKATSKKFGISHTTVRQILVSHGIACTDRQREILAELDAGLTTSQIAKKLGVAERTIKMYLPYTKGSYLATPPSQNAMRIRKCRNKNTAEG